MSMIAIYFDADPRDWSRPGALVNTDLDPDLTDGMTVADDGEVVDQVLMWHTADWAKVRAF